MNEDVLARAAADLARGERVGDDAAEGRVNLLGRALELVVGEEGHDERAGSYARRRIGSKTNLHGGPFGGVN